MSLISVQKTQRYDSVLLRLAVEEHFAALEVEKDLAPGMKVLLKPNLLAARKPEQAVTTHPLLIQAVIDWLRDRDIRDITLADSPGGPYTEGRLRSVYAASGMDTLTGVKLNLDPEAAPVEQPRGKNCRRFDVIGPVRQADYIIDLPKVKTHGMTVVSLGVKNLFGVVPGLGKPALHYQYPGWEDFSGMLLDLADLIAPAVTLVDGVLAMEGDGPSGGTPRELGYTFASRDVFALDRFLAGTVMGLDPDGIPMLRQAWERGWGTEAPVLTGDALEAIPPFARPKTQDTNFTGYLPGFLQSPVRAAMTRIFRHRPKILWEKCIGCGRCAESCPQGIITITGGKAKIAPRGCISCYCCQEMCPVQAVK